MANLYEVEVQNRVVKGIFSKRITGQQGSWYPEKLLFLADSENEARKFAEKQIRSRRILGMSGLRKRKGNIRREIKITNIRRLL